MSCTQLRLRKLCANKKLRYTFRSVAIAIATAAEKNFQLKVFHAIERRCTIMAAKKKAVKKAAKKPAKRKVAKRKSRA